MDLAFVVPSYTPGEFPLTSFVDLPWLFDSGMQASKVLWKVHEKYLKDEYKDVVPLWMYTTEPGVFHTVKKQVKTLEDLKGLKIRMMGGPSTEQMKALGGIPVSVAMPENYMALQKGVIDGMGAPWEATNSFRLYEVVKYYTLGTNFPVVYFSLAVNKKKWNSLPKDVQDVLTKASGLEGAKFWGRNFFDTAKDACIAKAKKEGFEVNIYELPQEERAKWLEVGGKPVWDNWLNKMKKGGHPEAKEILDALLGMF